MVLGGGTAGDILDRPSYKINLSRNAGRSLARTTEQGLLMFVDPSYLSRSASWMFRVQYTLYYT